MKQKEIIVCTLLVVLACLCGFFAIVPIAIYGVAGEGVYALFAFGACSLLCALFWSRMKPILRRIAFILTAAVLTGSLVLSIIMGKAAFFTKPEGTEETVILLGCQVKGEIPSLILQRRIDAAAEYLQKHPDLPVIVSGGQGPGERITEAEAMKRGLVRQGIAKERIYLEDRSHNTAQNLIYSAELIEKEKLPKTVTVVTDGFHQFRASLYAKREGLEPAAVSSHTPLGLETAYWVREFFGIAKVFVLERG